MKRCCLALLALLLLAACGRAEPAPVTAAPTTTEVETTVLSGTAILMETDTATVFETVIMWPSVQGYAGKFVREIWLRDKATGEETLLLEPDYDNERDNVVPLFVSKINERYFIFVYGIEGTDAQGGPTFYDLEKLHIVQVDYNGIHDAYFDHVADGKIHINEWMSDGSEIFRSYTINIAALDSDGPITLKEVR